MSSEGLHRLCERAGVPLAWARRLEADGELAHLRRINPLNQCSGYRSGATQRFLADRYQRDHLVPAATAATTATDTVTIDGITPADKIPAPARVWEKALGIQHGKMETVRKRYSQRISIPVGSAGDEPSRLLAVNTGNHDNRTIELAGIDWILELLRDCTTLYDQHEILFTLEFGGYSRLWKLRHRWRYKSVLNPFHAYMRDLDRVDDFDVAVGGHVHSGTHYARWDHHSRETQGPTDRYAVLIGTYEYHSKYGLKCGFSRHTGRGSATLIIWPDGGQMMLDSVQLAAAFLGYARDYYPAPERPVGIALLSDIHIGNEYTDYQQVYDDTRTIVTTPGLYAMILGDVGENWIGALEGIQRAQPMSHGEETALVRCIIGALAGDPKHRGEFCNG